MGAWDWFGVLKYLICERQQILTCQNEFLIKDDHRIMVKWIEFNTSGLHMIE